MITKGKAAGLVVLFVAIGLITATGAFTTVTAERTATVSTAGDSAALLSLTPSDGSNGDYVDDSGDTIEINLDSPNGDGVNLNALTQIDDMLVITNQGTQEVGVYITKSGNNSDLVTFYDGVHTNSSRVAIESDGNAHVIGTGESFNVSMDIDTRGEDLDAQDEILTGITVHANATSS
jgi:hypothetical protein